MARALLSKTSANAAVQYLKQSHDTFVNNTATKTHVDVLTSATMRFDAAQPTCGSRCWSHGTVAQ